MMPVNSEYFFIPIVIIVFTALCWITRKKLKQLVHHYLQQGLILKWFVPVSSRQVRAGDSNASSAAPHLSVLASYN